MRGNPPGGHARRFPSPPLMTVHSRSSVRALRKAAWFSSGRSPTLRPGDLGSSLDLELTNYATPDVYLTKTSEPTKYEPPDWALGTQ